MLETLNRSQKAAFAEARAFQKYGGIRHPNLHGTIPDLLRVHDGKIEFIEVKYIDLAAFSTLNDRLCGLKLQLTKRKKFLPKGATQRVYILFDNPEAYEWGDEVLIETVLQRLEGLDVSVDIDVLRDEEAEANA